MFLWSIKTRNRNCIFIIHVCMRVCCQHLLCSLSTSWPFFSSPCPLDFTPSLVLPLSFTKAEHLLVGVCVKAENEIKKHHESSACPSHIAVVLWLWSFSLKCFEACDWYGCIPLTVWCYAWFPHSLAPNRKLHQLWFVFILSPFLYSTVCAVVLCWFLFVCLIFHKELELWKSPTADHIYVPFQIQRSALSCQYDPTNSFLSFCLPTPRCRLRWWMHSEAPYTRA